MGSNSDDAGGLITLPLRLWLRSAVLLTRAAGDVGSRAAAIGGKLLNAVTSDGSAAPHRPFDQRKQPQEPPAFTPEAVSRQPATPERRAAPEFPSTGGGVSEPVRHLDSPSPPALEVPPTQEAAHVSEQPELVHETAEPGAEEGAGAAVRVTEPWEGYQQMTARQVIGRLQNATPAELVAVRLYEIGNRSRQTVLDAVDRQMKTVNGSGSSR